MRLIVVFAFLLRGALTIYLSNTTLPRKGEDNPAFWTETGIWGPMLEDWALTSHRESRVMKFAIPSQAGYLTIQRSDKVIEERESAESKISPTKIVNTGIQNTKKPPGRQVSETDLYLLGAIEKLVYRVDFMEKRLRRVEEMMYFVMAGNRIDQEPCPDNFTRAGSNCYLFASQAGRELDWKAANKHCRRMGSVLAEMETIEENQDVVAQIQSNAYLKGKDFWTGGLNPGLLWIWSNSARPVATSKNDTNKQKPTTSIVGDGRCLRLAYDPALRSYAYKGTDCSVRYSYICEKPEATSSNEIKKVGRKMKIIDN